MTKVKLIIFITYKRVKTYYSNLYFLHIIPISKWKEKSLLYIDIISQRLIFTHEI